MIGYEFEFLMQNRLTKEPISHEEFGRLHEALASDGWKTGRDPLTGGVVYSEKDGVKVTTDDSIYCAEVNMPPEENLVEADRKMKELIGYLKGKLEPIGIDILGIGMFPSHVPEEYDYTCKKAFIQYITPRRYFLNRTLMHRIAACQYWFDVPRQSLIGRVNLMNRLNGLCVALLGNSSFHDNERNPNIEERLPAWKRFVETPYDYDKKITGVPEKEFGSLLEYLDFCFKAPFYGCAWYSGMPYYLEDHSKTNGDYFFSEDVEVLHVDGSRKRISPSLGDLYDLVQKNMFLDCRAKFNFRDSAKVEDFKKAYLDRDEDAIKGLMKKAFVESRFIASQNQQEFSIGGAFLMGLLENLGKTEELLAGKDYGYWKELRDKAIRDGLDFEIEGRHVSDILTGFLDVSEQGLRERGLGEERFLERAKEFLSDRENPGQRKVRLFREGGIEKVIEDSLL
jgi:gamma-glutamylcysteine synthetase